MANFENETTIQIDTIIDTGCTHSNISADLFYVFWQNEEAERLREKERWMKCRKYVISRGVESANQDIDTSLTVDNPRLKILQHFYDVRINGLGIGNKDMLVSYDTKQIALLGMSILKDWDIHISKSLITGKTTLLACPLDKINSDYIQALMDEFDIGERMINDLINKIDYKAIEANHINNKAH